MTNLLKGAPLPALCIIVLAAGALEITVQKVNQLPIWSENQKVTD